MCKLDNMFHSIWVCTSGLNAALVFPTTLGLYLIAEGKHQKQHRVDLDSGCTFSSVRSSADSSTRSSAPHPRCRVTVVKNLEVAQVGGSEAKAHHLLMPSIPGLPVAVFMRLVSTYLLCAHRLGQYELRLNASRVAACSVGSLNLFVVRRVGFLWQPARFSLAASTLLVSHEREFSAFTALTMSSTIPPADFHICFVQYIQHETDWLSNRHGLILSFEDSADRQYQVNKQFCRGVYTSRY